MTSRNFECHRHRLHRYFEMKAASERLAINPIVRDERTIRLVERLYEEESPRRYFHVCPQDAGLSGLDAFSKKVGLDFDVTLFVLNTELDERFFPVIWDAYVAWMHESADANVVLNKIQSAGGSP